MAPGLGQWRTWIEQQERRCPQIDRDGAQECTQNNLDFFSLHSACRSCSSSIFIRRRRRLSWPSSSPSLVADLYKIGLSYTYFAVAPIRSVFASFCDVRKTIVSRLTQHRSMEDDGEMERERERVEAKWKTKNSRCVGERAGLRSTW